MPLLGLFILQIVGFAQYNSNRLFWVRDDGAVLAAGMKFAFFELMHDDDNLLLGSVWRLLFLPFS